MRETTKYHLAGSTTVEPLVNYWPAWSYLISPAAASLQLLNYQVRTMESYLLDPESHVKASRDPELLGGPFMDIAIERSDDVAALLASTEKKQKHNLHFAKAITDFYDVLINEARGQELDSFYQRMPYALRGFVELVYDYNNNPSMRFFEGLLYQSEYYDAGLQSLRLSQPETDSSRPFFMSTPCLPAEDQLDWAVSFDDPRVDELFKLDSEAQPLGYIREVLGLREKEETLLRRMLSDEPITLPEVWKGDEVRIRYFGHACVLVEWRGLAILTDPFIAAVPTRGGIDRLTYRDLPAKIDYALVTHNHCDHFVLETLLRLRNRIECVIVPRAAGLAHGDVSLKLMARKLGFKNVVELDALEGIPLLDGEITAIPFLGEHGDLPHGKAGYVVRAGKQKMLFAADSNCLDGLMYERVQGVMGAIQSVFIGTESVGAPLSWSYGPLLPKKPSHGVDRSRRQRGCDAERAWKILEAVGARRVYNYGMGQEPWLEHILALGLSEDSPQVRESDKLLARARERGFLAAERLFGRGEFFVEDSSEPMEWLSPAEFDSGKQNFNPAAAAMSDTTDAEDQFAF